VAGQQAARQHAVGGHADPQLAAGRQDLLLETAREERVLDLQVTDRVDGGRAANGVGAGLREADVADIARLDHLGDRAHGLLDRDVRVDARRPVDVDVVGPKAPQRVGEEVPDRLRAAVVSRPAGGGSRSAPNLTLTVTSSRSRP
jgi:hypothetical protein